MTAGPQQPQHAEEPVVVRDKRRLDPETGTVRTPPGEQPLAGAASQPEQGEQAFTADEPATAEASDELAAARGLAEERLGDLQRLQAEYVNYRRRVDRDRDVARASATTSLLEALLPVLDDVELARQHGDLEGGPFAAISDKLEAALGRFGLSRYGQVGESFDPSVHEALMHSESAEVTETVVTTVLQPGYKVGEKVLRPARVAVTSPA
ncbi:molecular chaperone GrpE [Quadrisphaera granulorum]|uniref:Protein GrpE n=1 Tax=Quadrisphaera granulorum TaxID=317664 RepID=A0A316AG15_9ACTN|nr:nucleotide exchange factor GrpE [Quadrisphaera granulorum]PWJ55854.1 molecular chaperone GrpE [Quadrisphaera granulorum]SZE95351.1 molecular chaperone GrpE [Quadrisphaera granulorum]